MFIGFLVGPAAFLLFLSVPKLRPGVRYLGIYWVTTVVTFGAMLLAPSQFLNWWID